MSRWLFSFFIALAASVITSVAHAQPSLKMMIPANPGGGWDQTGRHLAAAMQSAKLVSSVQFDNKGGAGGTIGLAQFINAAKGDANAIMIGGMIYKAYTDGIKPARPYKRSGEKCQRCPLEKHCWDIDTEEGEKI